MKQALGYRLWALGSSKVFSPQRYTEEPKGKSMLLGFLLVIFRKNHVHALASPSSVKS
jgi:hypothetical protein